MKLAIHASDHGFHPRWVAYCEANGIAYERVDCHASDVIERLRDVDGLMWHHGQMNPRDLIAAKAVLSSLEHAGFPVFPDWRTAWHFDDKVAQKYLLEAIDAPLVPTWVFLDERSAMDWIETTSFPKVFKLRGGAGSANVRLVHGPDEARRLVRRAFRAGFAKNGAVGSLKERWRKVRLGKAPVWEAAKGVARFLRPPAFAGVLGRERGYAYFQEFLANNESDTRIIIIGDKAFALKRYVRADGFRGPSSRRIWYRNELVWRRFLASTATSMDATPRWPLQRARLRIRRRRCIRARRSRLRLDEGGPPPMRSLSRHVTSVSRRSVRLLGSRKRHTANDHSGSWLTTMSGSVRSRDLAVGLDQRRPGCCGNR